MQLRNRNTGDETANRPLRQPRSSLDSLLSSSDESGTFSSDEESTPINSNVKEAAYADHLSASLSSTDNADTIHDDSTNPGTSMFPSLPGMPEENKVLVNTPDKKPNVLSSPLARSLKKEDLFPTSESEAEIKEDTKVVKESLAVRLSQALPMESTSTVAKMPSPSTAPPPDSPDSEVQFVKKRIRKLKKCTRPTSLSSNQTIDHAELSRISDERNGSIGTAFADDPVRTPQISVSQKEIEDLKGPNFLTTTLLDYLTQLGVPKDIPDDVLIGSSNCYRYFEIQNEKDIESEDAADARSARLLQRKYQSYNMKRHRFLAINCSSSHFVVISVVFDITLDDFFEDVYVYDSFRRSARSKEAVIATSIPAKFLLEFQLFLANFCFFNTKRHNPASATTFDLAECIICELSAAAKWMQLRPFRVGCSSPHPSRLRSVSNYLYSKTCLELTNCPLPTLIQSW